MVDVKWIKIATNIFDDEKILIIEKLPNADSIIVIWFKLLTLAGKQNNSGVFIMNNRIAYTDEMLAAIFRRDLNLVKMALSIFESYGMIEIIEGTLTIPNWSKHQSLDKISARAEYQKKYMQEYRRKQKLLAGGNNSKTNCKPNSKPKKTSVSEIEEELDKEQEIDIDKEQQLEEKDNGCCSRLSMSDVFNTYQNEIGLLSPTISDTFKAYESDISIELMILAIKTAVKSNARRLNYIEGIFKNWTNEGIHTIDELKAKELERKATKDSKISKPISKKVEKFNTMYSHDWDFDEIERLEREYIDRMLEGDKSE